MNNKYRNNYKQLGLNISYYRRLKGLTQLQLSELLEIDRTHMGNIELARTGVSLDILFRLSKLLDIPINKFFDNMEYSDVSKQ